MHCTVLTCIVRTKGALVGPCVDVAMPMYTEEEMQQHLTGPTEARPNHPKEVLVQLCTFSLLLLKFPPMHIQSVS